MNTKQVYARRAFFFKAKRVINLRGCHYKQTFTPHPIKPEAE
jgi:hypothetical protein